MISLTERRECGQPIILRNICKLIKKFPENGIKEESMKLGIFTAFDNYHKYYIRACESLNVNYEIVDIISSDWLQNVQDSDCDGFLCRPPSKFQERKSMFDERLYIIYYMLKRLIYPSYNELYLYENKRMTSYWLDLNNFPKAETWIFYRKSDFKKFIKEYNDFPIVIKSNIGSTAKGVSIIHSKKQANSIANKAFGLIKPKLARGYTSITTGKIIPLLSRGSRERHFVIVQKFEEIKWEWRIVKIDDSYFGHKKLMRGYFASGTHLKDWGKPPDELLFLVKNICEKGDFLSMSADILETKDGRYLVNELQSLFGQPVKDLMLIDDKPGRFVYKDNKFVFEEGHFNQHNSYLLRVKHFIKIINQSNNKKRNLDSHEN